MLKAWSRAAVSGSAARARVKIDRPQEVHLMKDYVVTTIALLLLFFGASLIIDLENLLCLPAIQQVLAPLLIITLAFRTFTNIQISELWFWVGISLGITSSSICLLSLLYNVAGADGFEQQIA
jgi:hypothetical protein